MKLLNRTGISKKFIISISILFSILMLFAAVFYRQIISSNISILKESISGSSAELAREKSNLVMASLKYSRAEKPAEISKVLSEICREDLGFIDTVIYSKTDDENYFKAVDRLKITDVNFSIKPGDIVKEGKETNFLSKALTGEIIDPEIYSSGIFSWQNSYFSYGNKKKYIVQLFISAEPARKHLDKYLDSVKTQRLIITAVSSILVLIVIILSVIFIQNYTLLLKKLSEFMKNAAGGNLSLNMNPEASVEMSELASSFNILIEEMKDMKIRADRSPESDLFILGVEKIKNNNYQEAIFIFRTLTILKPESFVNFFNSGVAYAKIKEYQNALSMFKRADEINSFHEMTKKYIDKINALILSNGK
jgi:HAMP domain-containing protein